MRRLLVVALMATLSIPVSAQCVSSKRAPGTVVNYTSIYLHIPPTVPSPLVSAIQKGAQAWNATGKCPSGGFPPVNLSPQGTFRQMNVSWQAGFQPDGGDACGEAIGNTIILYEKARLPSLEIVSCSRSDILEDTVSHELGHVYQLNDSGCGNYIMGQVNVANGQYTNRTIRGDECAKVDDTYMTPSELEEEIGGPDGGDPDAPPGPGMGGTPILVDLDRGGFRLTDLAGGVWFDLDRDGAADAISWTEPGHEDAWLTLDRNGNGTIDDGGELFGNFTDQPSSSDPNGYRALAMFDEDGDGKLSAADSIFGELRLWADQNQDGVSQPSELKSLADAGVLWVALDPVESRHRDPHGNEYRYKALVRLVRGMTQSVDVFLLSAP